MLDKFKKIISIISITLLLSFQIVNVQAYDVPSAPTPPPEPESTTSVPEAPEAPTPPPAPTLESTPEPTPTEAPAIVQEDQSEDNENTQSNNQEIQNTSGSNTDPDISQSNLSDSGSSGNVGDTTIETGDGQTAGSLVNIANTNTVSQGPAQTDGSTGTNIENTGNGSDSENSASLDSESSTSTTQENTAIVGNSLNLDTATGNNSASLNVGNSIIQSGDANTSGTLVNVVNTNLAGLMVSEFNVVDDQIGDLILDFDSNCILGCGLGGITTENSGNGSDSENLNNVTQVISNDTFQNNEVIVENTMTLNADSGNNEADKNTGGDSTIQTGDANISANLLNFINTNVAGQVLVGIVNIFGDLIGDIILPDDPASCTNCSGDISASNTGNGTSSTNFNDVNQTINNNTTQSNIADIKNNLNVSATTGENIASKNTGGNSTIETGEASVDAQALNIANSNINGGDWWLVIVNQAGEWIGQILGAPIGANFAGTSGTDFTVAPDGSITANNSGNGSGSENTNSINQTTDNNLTQNNNAQIVNNLNLSANTGNNSTSKNTGGNNFIDTGDATIIANLINFVNTNITSTGRLRVITVNVFGKWIGDFISPGQEKSESNNTQAIGMDAGQNNPLTPQGGTGGNNSSQANIMDNNSGGNSTDDGNNTLTVGNTNNTVQPNNLPQVQLFTAPEDTQNIIFDEETNSLPNQVLGVKTQQIEDLKKVVDINLAWLLVTLPLLAISIKLVHKFSLLKLLRRKD